MHYRRDAGSPTQDAETPVFVAIEMKSGIKPAKVEGSYVRDDGVRVWTVRPLYGMWYSKKTLEVTAKEILEQLPS